MPHIIKGGTNAAAENALLANMFSARKRVFVDLLGWEVPVIEGRFEVDQFDGPATVYLMIAARNGDHLGSMRLLPSDRPNILRSIFPQLCEGPPPETPEIWEISRFCLSRGLRAAERRVTRDQLVTATVQFARENRIRGYCCVADMGWMSQILSFGWECRPLGLPQPLSSGMTGALEITIDETTQGKLETGGIWNETAMHWADPCPALAS